MTLEAFLVLLERTRDMGEWEIDSGGLRCGKYCPITAVVKKMIDIEYVEDDYEEAAVVLGLPKDVTQQIVEAADTCGDDKLLKRMCLTVNPNLKDKIDTWDDLP